ncbi:MAG: hypothetical protein ACK6DX_24465 [Acidobacteriota bacterium]
MSKLHRIGGTGNDSRKADVVFIHGLGGDAFGTWRHGQDEDSSWPHWLAKKNPEVGVWSLGYAASPSKWPRLLRLFGKGNRDTGHAMPLPARAKQSLDLLRLHLGEREGPLLFICHSLGGLLAKHMLRLSWEAGADEAGCIARRTRAVLFLATPHHGATLASLAHSFSAVFQTTVSMEDLRAHDAHLLELYDWYRNHAPDLAIKTVTYYESREVGGILPIVKPAFAQAGTGKDAVALDDDHISISKPRDFEGQLCLATHSLLRSLIDQPLSIVPAFQPPREAIVVQIDSSLLAREGEQPIPCQLPPQANQFVGRRKEVQQLTERLRERRNTAVAGAAGLGKTALAATALREVIGPAWPSLTHTPFAAGLVFLDFYSHRGQTEPAWQALANVLRGPLFLERRPARERAEEACRHREFLLVVEGAEEAGERIHEFLAVLSPENRWLLLTRDATQCSPIDSIYLRDSLSAEESGMLFDALTGGRRFAPDIRERVLELMDGHPLALHWAAGLLSGPDEDPEAILRSWREEGLTGSLHDPSRAQHTLEWLFNRSTRGLNEEERGVLSVAGFVAHRPVAQALLETALGVGAPSAGSAIQTLVRRSLLQRRTDPKGWMFSHVLAYKFCREGIPPKPAIAKRIASWVGSEIASVPRLDTTKEHLDGARGLLQHAEALLQTSFALELWEILVESLLYETVDRFEEIGRLDLAATALAAVDAWFKMMPEAEADLAEWQREQGVLWSRKGNLRREQGELGLALEAFRQSLAIGERLASADPSNATWQRDLSVAQNNVGKVLRDQGELGLALEAFRQSLARGERLASADPSNATWQRDLEISRRLVEEIRDLLPE